MAGATRSQVMLREVEERVGELQAIGGQHHEEMKGEINQLYESMTHVSRQLMEILHHNTNQHRGQYQAPTRFTKMNLPKFMKDDVVGWLSKCKSYFDLDKTPSMA